jgi:hypothetical protein
MSKECTFSFPVVSFRNLETPFEKQGHKDYFAIVNVNHLPDLSQWRRINVRDPKLTGSVPRAIRDTFTSKQDMFVFMNRGIVLAVEDAEYDNKTNVVTIKMSDPALHGLLDGGHTYNIIMQELGNVKFPQFVRLEILEGFSSEDITDVVDARNTSNQVRDESLMNLAGEFELLKRALEDAPYFNQIAFKEYEVDEKGNPKPIDVREVIAILTALDKDHFNETTHPINSYRSKAACVKHFKDNPKSYRKLYPLAQQILGLYDEIQYRLPELYNKARGQSGSVSGGKFGKLTGVSVYEGNKSTSLYYIGKQAKYGVPAGFVYPILGAFRALLEEKAGKYSWGKGINPVELLSGDLGLKLADTIGNFALEAQNPSKTGKSILVWQACYQSAEVHYLRMIKQ